MHPVQLKHCADFVRFSDLNWQHGSSQRCDAERSHVSRQAGINCGAVDCFQHNRDTQTFGHLLPCRGTRGRLQKEAAACVPLLRCQAHGLRCYQEEPQQIAGKMLGPSCTRWHIPWFNSMLSFFSYKNYFYRDRMINPASKAVSNSDPFHLSSHHVSSFHTEVAAFQGHAWWWGGGYPIECQTSNGRQWQKDDWPTHPKWKLKWGTGDKTKVLQTNEYVMI